MMDLDIVMTKNQEEKRSLNSVDPHINRGFKLMLETQGKEPEKHSNFFDFNFNKRISLFKRKIKFCLTVSLDISK